MSDISRRHLFQTAAVVAGAIGAAVAGVKAQPYPGEGGYSAPPQMGEEAQYARKQSKDEAEYQDYPNHGQHCEACANFLGPDHCRIVAGEISPGGWCRNFKPRA